MEEMEISRLRSIYCLKVIIVKTSTLNRGALQQWRKPQDRPTDQCPGLVLKTYRHLFGDCIITSASGGKLNSISNQSHRDSQTLMYMIVWQEHQKKQNQLWTSESSNARCLYTNCKINKIKPKLQYYKKNIGDIQNIKKYITVKNNQEKKHTLEKWFVIQNVPV